MHDLTQSMAFMGNEILDSGLFVCLFGPCNSILDYYLNPVPIVLALRNVLRFGFFSFLFLLSLSGEERKDHRNDPHEDSPSLEKYSACLVVCLLAILSRIYQKPPSHKD